MEIVGGTELCPRQPPGRETDQRAGLRNDRPNQPSQPPVKPWSGSGSSTEPIVEGLPAAQVLPGNAEIQARVDRRIHCKTLCVLAGPGTELTHRTGFSHPEYPSVMVRCTPAHKPARRHVLSLSSSDSEALDSRGPSERVWRSSRSDFQMICRRDRVCAPHTVEPPTPRGGQQDDLALLRDAVDEAERSLEEAEKARSEDAPRPAHAGGRPRASPGPRPPAATPTPSPPTTTRSGRL